MSLMKLTSPTKSEKRVDITIYEPTSDKRGYPITIEETISGKSLPKKYARAYLVGDGDNTFFSMSGPIRKLDDDGVPLTKAKMKDSNYIAEDGSVTTEDLADRVSVYMQNSENQQLVYSDLGTINIENTKKDNTPTKFTLASMKIYSDQEALSIAKLHYLLSYKGNEIKKDPENMDELKSDVILLKEKINEMKKSSGLKQNAFIKDNTNFLKSLGFEYRENKPVKESESSMGY
jgi:hypothetical protein